MRARRISGLLAVLTIASCGGDATAPSVSESSTVLDPSTTAPTPSSDVPTPPLTEPSASTSTPEPTMPPSTPPSPGSTSPPATPPRDLLDPWPASAIDWGDVGSGWVAFRYVVPDELDEPDADYDVTLMLLSPTDDVYEVGSIPGPDPTAYRIQDISPDGRAALMWSRDDDPNFISLLDLQTMTLTPFAAPESAWAARFGRRDSSVLVEQRFTTRQPSGSWRTDRIVLSRIAPGGSGTEVIVDLAVSPERQEAASYFTWVELGSGEIATTEEGVVRLRAPDGRLLRQLHAPSADCTLVTQWSDGEVLARCPDPEQVSGCWTNGLFLIPTTGGAPTQFAMPSSPGACVAGYVGAVPLAGALALQRVQGEGECTQLIEIADGTSSSTWQPGNQPVCNSYLIGVRTAGWLALARPLDGTLGSQYEGPGVLYEISADGRTRPISPTTLVSSWNFTGVTDVHIIGVT